MYPTRLVTARLALVLLLGACAREVPVAQVAGTCGDVFTGRVCTWAHTRGDTMTDAGATVPITTIDSAPAVAPMTWPPTAGAILAMPASAATATGLTEFTLLWEATGHPPAPFMTPHFDFHFYLVPTAERSAITCADHTKPAVLPAGYVLPDMALPPDMAKMTGVDTLIGVCVPTMGMHSLPAAAATGTAPFTGTMVVGYYGGKPIFIEPMISRAMLAERKSFDLPIPTIPGTTGAYPHVFHAVWDAAGQSYRFTFSDFAS